MAMLEFEALGLDRVRVDLAAQYVDHNLLQTDLKNTYDHRYLQSSAARYGVHFSLPDNGISHQVHLENFGKPELTLIGADSNTPAAAGLSMLAFGAGNWIGEILVLLSSPIIYSRSFLSHISSSYRIKFFWAYPELPLHLLYIH